MKIRRFETSEGLPSHVASRGSPMRKASSKQIRLQNKTQSICKKLSAVNDI